MLEQPGFVIQQPGLGVQPAGEAGQLARTPDHAVARHDNPERVLPVGRTDRPAGLGIT